LPTKKSKNKVIVLLLLNHKRVLLDIKVILVTSSENLRILQFQSHPIPNLMTLSSKFESERNFSTSVRTLEDRHWLENVDKLLFIKNRLKN
jgi:hypothetical protein